MPIEVRGPSTGGGGAGFTAGNSTFGNTAGDTGLVTGQLVFVGSNNITLSGSTNAGSMTLSFFGGAGAAGNTGSLSAGTTRGTLGEIVFSNSNGVSFGMNGQTMTAAHNALTSQSNQNVTAGNGGFAFQTLSFSDLNGISFGTSAGSAITASHNALTSQSNQAFSAAGGSSAFQTLSFNNANGFTFSNNGGAVEGSYTVPTQSNQTGGVYFVGNTTGQSSSSTYDLRTLSIDGAGIVSAGWSNSTIRISATQSNQAFSAAGGSSAFQTLSFNNANGFSFSNNGGAVEGSYTVPTVPAQFSGGMSTNGNTSGDTGFVTGRLALIGGNNITLSGSTNGGSMSITFSGGGGGNFSAGVSTGGNTSGDTGITGTRIVFAGGNNITLSQATDGNGATITFSAPNLGGGAFSAGASNLGNTAGSTGVTGTRFVFVGTNGASLSQSTDANGGTLTINGINTMNLFAGGNTYGTSSGTASQKTVSLIGTGGIYVAASDSGFVVSRPILSDYEPFPALAGGANTAVTQALGAGAVTSGSILVWPMQINDYVKAEYMNIIMSQNFTTLGTSSGRETGGCNYGIYTQQTGTNSTRMSRLTTGSFGYSVTGNNSSYTINYPTTTNTAGFTTGATNSAGVNVTSKFTGQKLLVLPVSTIFTPGAYYLALQHTLSTSSINVGLSHSWFGRNVGSTILNLAPFGELSSQYTGTYLGRSAGPWFYHMGSYTSANLATLPDSIPLSGISKGVNQTLIPYVRFWCNT